MTKTKLILRETAKIILCLGISAVLIWLSFFSIMAMVFNVVFIPILILVWICIALMAYLSFWFIHLSENYDLHTIEKINKD